MQWFESLTCIKITLKGLINDYWLPPSKFCIQMLGAAKEFCVSKKFPNEANATSVGSTFENHWQNI